MKNSLRAKVLYPAFLLMVVGVAYYGGKSAWFQPREMPTAPMPPKKMPATQTPDAAQPARPVKVKTLEESKAFFADLLAGNWPDQFKSKNDKQNYIRGFLRSAEFDPKDVPDLIALLHDAPDNADQQLMIFELLGRIAGNIPPGLGGANPALALQLLDNLSDPAQWKQMLGTALNRLATDDPQAAWKELTSLPPGTAPTDIYAAIFSNLAKQDPAGAAADAVNLPPGPDRDNALQGVGKSWISTDPQAALNWASSLPGSESLVNGMIQSLAANNPKLAESYVNDMTDPIMRNDTITTIGRRLQNGPNGDPAAALAWFNQTATGSAYQTAVANLFEGLSTPSMQTLTSSDGNPVISLSTNMKDISLAVSLVANVTDPTAQQAAIASVAGGWAQSDPRAALTWVNSLPDSEATARAAAMNTIVTTWSNTDPAAAVAFVQNSADPSVFQSIAPTLAQTLAATNPQAALAFAQSLSAGTAQTQALSNVLVGLAGSNFTAAWTDATNLPQGDAQNTIMTNLVATEAKANPAQAAALLNNIPDPTAQITATSTLATTWIKLDPQAFTTWLDTLPAGDVRDTAIAQLVSSKQATKNPAGVLAWANTVANPQTKAALLQQLAQAQTAAK